MSETPAPSAEKDAGALGIESVTALLTEHPRINHTAGWNGSPDPSNWRNIRPACVCNERLIDKMHWTRAEAQEAHRRHVAEQIVTRVLPHGQGATD